MHSFLRSFWRRENGVVLIETAAIIPLLAILIVSSVETSRLLILAYKLEKTATTVADLIAREGSADPGIINDIMGAVPHVMAPFSLQDDGVVIVSSVTATDDGGNSTVNWQMRGAGSLVTGSTIGTTGGSATLPNDLQLREDVTVVVAEIVYNYSFVLTPDWSPLPELRYTATFRPRHGGLEQLN